MNLRVQVKRLAGQYLNSKLGTVFVNIPVVNDEPVNGKESRDG